MRTVLRRPIELAIGCRDARTTAVDSSGAVIGGDDPYAQTQEALPSRISVRDDRRPLR